MWPFNSVKNIRTSGLFDGFVDHHSHILPNVDDGITTLDNALKVLECYEGLGVKKVWLTPHIMEDMPNEPLYLQEVFSTLQNAWQGRVQIDLGAEHMLDNLFIERLRDGKVLPIGKDKTHLLVETSYFTPPMEMDGMLREIQRSGYFPILAHPERYRYMDENDYKRLKDMGIYYQINFLSVVGGYGDTARKKVEWLLSHDMVDVVGSDIHRLDAFQTLIEKAPKNKAVLDKIVKVAQNPRLSL